MESQKYINYSDYVEHDNYNYNIKPKYYFFVKIMVKM